MASTIRQAADSPYMKLIAELPLRPIRSVAEYTKAKRMVLRLSTLPGNRQILDYLEILVSVVADYERRSGDMIDTSNPSAADLVRHRIQERGMSVSALARLIGISQSNLSAMLSGKRDWSKSAIRQLASHLHIRADRFLA